MNNNQAIVLKSLKKYPKSKLLWLLLIFGYIEYNLNIISAYVPSVVLAILTFLVPLVTLLIRAKLLTDSLPDNDIDEDKPA